MKKFDFINDDLHLVNDDGHTVDREGRLVNEDGRFIDKDGNFVDKEGTPINEEGEYIIETKPFLDDDGNELIIEDKEEPKKTKKTKDYDILPEEVEEDYIVWFW